MILFNIWYIDIAIGERERERESYVTCKQGYYLVL